jgi:hypothetical protein
MGFVGAGIGLFVTGGNPVGAYYGFMGGMAVGSVVFPTQLPGLTNEGPRIDDLKVQSSTYGMMLPIMFGVVRASGNMIWSTAIVEHRHESTEEVGGKGAPKQDVTTVTYTYTVSCAVSLCEGPIIGVRKIWGNKELFYNIAEDIDFATNQAAQAINPHIRVYLGTEDQEPDPLILATEGDAPAYRGTAYIVFENLPLEQFFNRIPNFEFEVVASGSIEAPAFVPLDDIPAEVAGSWSSTGATWVNASVTPHGLILAVLGVAGGANRIVLIDPFSGNIVREYPIYQMMKTAANIINAPYASETGAVMNNAGDICWNAVNRVWVMPNGGEPTYPRNWSFQAGRAGPVTDGNNFYVGALVTPVLVGNGEWVIRLNHNGTTGKALYKAPAGIPIATLFHSQDGNLWVSQSNGTTSAAILKLDDGNGGVRGQLNLPYFAKSIAIAGDGSLWYWSTSGVSAERGLWRVTPDLGTSTRIWTEPSSLDTEETNLLLARDWATGDIIANVGASTGDVFRFSADGTLIRTYTGGDFISHFATNPNYPS